MPDMAYIYFWNKSRIIEKSFKLPQENIDFKFAKKSVIKN